MHDEVVEEYLKTILLLSEKGEPVKTTEIAKSLGLAPATITEGLQKLAENGLVDYKPYHGASLTSEGRSIASKIRRKHRLLERFLTDMLGLESSNVHKQACKLEHSLSDEAEVALCRVLNHPDTCSDDAQAIPPCDLDVESCVECKEKPITSIKSRRERSALKSLTQLRKGEKARVLFIRGGRSAVSRLHNMGVTKDAEIQMLKRAPFSGPVEVCVRGCKLALGRGVASKIFVK